MKQDPKYMLTTDEIRDGVESPEFVYGESPGFGLVGSTSPAYTEVWIFDGKMGAVFRDEHVGRHRRIHRREDEGSWPVTCLRYVDALALSR